MFTLPEQRNWLLGEDLEKTDSSNFKPLLPRLRRHMRRESALGIVLVISLCANVYLALKGSSNIWPAPTTQQTKFAGLVFDIPSQLEYDTVYNSDNESLNRVAWEAINYDRGSIALTVDEAMALSLLEAQQFPWDDGKRLYFLNGHHSLHCLKTISQTLFDFRDGKSLRYPFRHSLHCMDAVRQDIICFADDMPRYTSAEDGGDIGAGQRRMCRSWSKLDEWSLQHTSCWRDINPFEDTDTLLRYRYCPEGSPYNDRIKAIFGKFDKGPDASASTQPGGTNE